MSDGTLRRVEEVFAEALEVPPEKRPAFLEARCAGDEALKAEVASLLRHDASAREDLEAAVGDAVKAATGPGMAPLEAGRRVGPWRLVRELGQGGMGSVWLAERVEGGFAQVVAVKLVKPGMDVGPILARFQAERRILAGLLHPSIARLYDGGSTEDGRPYLAMEYVDGLPLTRYASERDLSLPARLSLFLVVCDAVSFAHRSLVIHRDLKPANILVTRDGVPKLLDFGIAKLVDPEGEGTRTTSEWQAFTPEYASPEQVLGEPITTASDVYSLGAILYELLTGARAQPVDAYTPVAVHRRVVETDPTLPSRAPAAGARALRGDLDAIVMKALRKEPESRYASVAELADDLRRHLAKEPVRARKGTLSYRAGRFVTRHRAAVAATLVVAVSLVGGIVAATWQARERAREARRAERRFQQVRGLATSFLFDFHDRIALVPGTVEARELVVTKALETLDSLAAEAHDDPGLRRELAAAYVRAGRVQGLMDNANLGRLEQALSSFRKAEALLLELLRSEPEPRLRGELTGVRLDMGVTLDGLGRRDEAVRVYRAGLAEAREVHRVAPTRRTLGILASTLNRLGDTLLASGDPDGAALLYDEVRSLAPEGGTTLARQALAARDRGDLERALAVFEEAVDLVDRGRNTGDPVAESGLRAALTMDRARTLWTPDRPSLLRPGEAPGLVAAALETFEHEVKADPRDASAQHELLDALLSAGELLAGSRPDESLAAFAKARACLEALERAMPDVKRTNDRGRWASGSALALRGLGRREEAAPRLGEALEAYRAASAERPDDLTASDGLWTATVRLGDLHLEAGRLEDAVRTQRDALEQARRRAAALPARPLSRFFVADSCERLARALKGTGRPDDIAEAGRLLNEAEGSWRALRGNRLTPAYADARLSGLEALRGELVPRKSQAPPPPGLTSAPARPGRRSRSRARRSRASTGSKRCSCPRGRTRRTSRSPCSRA